VCVVLPSAIVRWTGDLAPIVLFSDDLVRFSDGVAMIVLRPDDLRRGSVTHTPLRLRPKKSAVHSLSQPAAVRRRG